MRIVIAVQQDQFTPALEQRLSCRVIFPGELALAHLLRMSGSCVPIHISASSRFSAITASGTTAALVEPVATALCLASSNDRRAWRKTTGRVGCSRLERRSSTRELLCA